MVCKERWGSGAAEVVMMGRACYQDYGRMCKGFVERKSFETGIRVGEGAAEGRPSHEDVFERMGGR